MMWNRGWRIWSVGCFALSSVLALLANAGSTPKQDHAWKRYYNPQWGYCVSYPSRWLKEEAFEGAGIFVKTGVKKRSMPIGEIDVGVLPDAYQPSSGAPQLSLVDNLHAHLDGLKKFERAQQMQVLEQRPMDLSGKSALYTKERYYDPLDRATLVQEIVFVQQKDSLYRLELECNADQVARFEPVFTRLVSTFQFDCSAPR